MVALFSMILVRDSSEICWEIDDVSMCCFLVDYIGVFW